jgi:hypothetical protein
MTMNLREKKGKEAAAIQLNNIMKRQYLNCRCFLPPIQLKNVSSRMNPPSTPLQSYGYKVDE